MHLKWLLPLLPPAQTYVEPFGGSAAVLLNRNQSSAEIYNDMHSEVVNFFQCLRDDRQELIRLIQLTPYSREEYKAAQDYKGCTRIERARAFYIRIRQAFGSQEGNTWSYSVNTIRRGMALNTSAWMNAPAMLQRVAQRLLQVQIENGDAITVINRYDTPKTLFYCDPPYVHTTRVTRNSYKHEFDDDHHRQLGEVLNSVKGRVAVSGYRCDLYDSLYPAPHWQRADRETRTTFNDRGKRLECLWTNYDPCNMLLPDNR